jgi:hypothetical protein
MLYKPQIKNDIKVKSIERDVRELCKKRNGVKR